MHNKKKRHALHSHLITSLRLVRLRISIFYMFGLFDARHGQVRILGKDMSLVVITVAFLLGVCVSADRKRLGTRFFRLRINHSKSWNCLVILNYSAFLKSAQ